MVYSPIIVLSALGPRARILPPILFTAAMLIIISAGFETINLGTKYNSEYNGSYLYLKNVTEKEKAAIEHKNMLLMKALEYDYYHAHDKYASAYRNFHY